jgi:hypothetical protein
MKRSGFLSSKAWILIDGKRGENKQNKVRGKTRMKNDLDHAGSAIHNMKKTKRR